MSVSLLLLLLLFLFISSIVAADVTPTPASALILQYIFMRIYIKVVNILGNVGRGTQFELVLYTLLISPSFVGTDVVWWEKTNKETDKNLKQSNHIYTYLPAPIYTLKLILLI